MAQSDIVRELHGEGAKQWRDIVVDLESFAEYCRGFGEPFGGAEMLGCAGDLYLCCACRLKDPGALATVVRNGTDVAGRAIARVCSDPEFVRETLQVLWEELLVRSDPKILSYSGKGSLSAWLRVVATRLAIDRSRARRFRELRNVELGEDFAGDVLGADVNVLRNRYATVFQSALREAFLGLSAKERTMLRLHVQERCSIDELGRVYGVHRATAARWLEQARKKILESIQRRFSAGPEKMNEHEVVSVAHALRSALEWSWASDTSWVHRGRPPDCVS